MKKQLPLAFALVVALGSVHAQEETLAYDDEGIQVFTHDVPGSEYQGFRGTVNVKVSPEVVRDEILNTAGVCSWYYNCATIGQIAAMPNGSKVVHMVIDMPWPVDDRDVVFRSDLLSEEQGYRIVNTRLSDNYLPQQPGLVRISALKSEWRLQKTDEGTRITLSTEAEPGGSIPSWLANSMVVDMPKNTLKNLRKQLEH